ncbi:MAG: hypothetical protein JWN34_1534 [Bryobacterales bacterium]|nr:hypothetical protein [Bryobacterales bacterium]
MTSREDCIQWYGEFNGSAVYDRWQAELKRIRENPTKIVAHPPAKPYCLECGGDNIGYKTQSNVEDTNGNS